MLLLLSMVFPFSAICQLSSGGTPPSFLYDQAKASLPPFLVQPPDLDRLNTEDQAYPSPYRFGVVLSADVNPEYSGEWVTLPGGEMIWRAAVEAPGALALSAYFDKFHLPDGGKLFVYNSDRSQVIGAFTRLNHSREGLFSTQLIAGDKMILEYVPPAGNQDPPLLHMNEITYAYRGVDFLEKEGYDTHMSGKCEVNINCPEGDDWQEEKKGVLKIHVKRGGATYWCTGSLVNNTREDNTPYVLTANHCGFDATQEELDQWVFYFDYECAECSFTGYPKPKAMTGATLKAHSGDELTSGSDFYLVRLNENIPDTFSVFYNGWSRSETTSSPSGVCIHHPGGDLKKISTYTKPLVSATWMGNSDFNHWKVYWAYTQSGHGVTEGGSSGCPLFDNQRRMVGFLSGGESACDTTYINLPDYFGKFSWAWESDGNDSTTMLKYWLDPDSTNLMVLNGRPSDSIPPVIIPIQAIYPNPFTNSLTVSLEDLTLTSAHTIVYDISGRIVFSGDYSINSIGVFEIPLGFLGSGMYFLNVAAGEMWYTRKIVKQ
jgi:hypothetical protein